MMTANRAPVAEGDNLHPAKALLQLGQSTNLQEIREALAVVRRSIACTDIPSAANDRDDLNLARALWQIGMSTSLQEIEASVSELKQTMARLKQERQELLEKRKSGGSTSSKRELGKEESWRGRGFWIIG